MSDSMCQHCGGLIAEPMKAYGWAGKWCHCAQKAAADGETFRPSRQAEIDELRRRLARLEDAERREQELAWRQYQAERRNFLAQTTFLSEGVGIV
jgi:phage terminase large subunit GpA-like protein